MTAQAATAQEQRATPLTRTVAVELRKMVDTRAGRWLLIVVAALSVLVVVGILIWGDPADASADWFLSATTIPLTLLLPVIGVMAATAEWTQRTGLVTFTLEPRRGRVMLAKLIAAVVLSLLVVAVAVVAALIGHFLAITLRSSDAGMGLTWATLGGTVAELVLDVLLGVAIGLALLNTPAAIVTTLLIPVALPVVGQLLGNPGWLGWLDLPSNLGSLASGDLHGAEWAHLLVSILLWIGIPLAVGLRRVTTGEVK